MQKGQHGNLLDIDIREYSSTLYVINNISFYAIINLHYKLSTKFLCVFKICVSSPFEDPSCEHHLN